MDPDFELNDPEVEAYLKDLADGDISMAVETGSPSVGHPQAVSPETLSSKEYTMTGRPAFTLYLSCDSRDPALFSEYQQLVRKQIEVFEADPEQVTAVAQGRNKPIVLGQVGIRCRHCAFTPHSQRPRGAVYFPSKLEGIYQMAQNMANTHLCDTCTNIPKDLRAELLRLRQIKTQLAGTGKESWAAKAQVLGVYEDSCGLRYTKTILG